MAKSSARVKIVVNYDYLELKFNDGRTIHASIGASTVMRIGWDIIGILEFNSNTKAPGKFVNLNNAVYKNVL